MILARGELLYPTLPWQRHSSFNSPFTSYQFTSLTLNGTTPSLQLVQNAEHFENSQLSLKPSLNILQCQQSYRYNRMYKEFGLQSILSLFCTFVLCLVYSQLNYQYERSWELFNTKQPTATEPRWKELARSAFNDLHELHLVSRWYATVQRKLSQHVISCTTFTTHRQF